MTDPPQEVCETCGEGPVQRVLYPVAVHFKGSGFYSTDYGRGSRKKESTSDGDGSAKKDDTKTKDKPAEKKAAASDG